MAMHSLSKKITMHLKAILNKPIILIAHERNTSALVAKIVLNFHVIDLKLQTALLT